MNRRGRIFLIEDDAFQRLRLKEALQDHYELGEPQNRASCLPEISEFHPDVILLDVVLDNADGLDLCRQIREDHTELRHTKIVLVSGRGSLEDRLLGYEAGADDYVTKPLNMDELLAKLHVFMRLRSAEEVNDLKGQFLNLMAHETRTPLTSIIGPANVLATDGIKDDDRRMFANMILESARRLEDLVEKAMELCTIRAGRADLEAVNMDLVTAVHSSVGNVAGFAKQKEVSIAVEAPSELSLTVDDRYLGLLIRTLLERAVRVSPESGAVAVSIEANENDVTVAIEDQGEAIDPAAMPTLFDDFSVPSVEFHTGSLGLDLALCGAIVTMFGGIIDVEPVDGGGARFGCRMPLRWGEPVSGAVTPVSERQPAVV